jgi:integrase
MPTENGLPPYVSKHPKTKLYRYFRRPPKGLVGAVFVRSFGTKDRKVVWEKWPAIHAEAEKYFERLRTGRSLTDREIELIVLSLPMTEAMFELPQSIPTTFDLDRFIDKHADDRVRGLSDPDRERLKDAVDFLNRRIEAGHLAALEMRTARQKRFFTKRFRTHAPSPTMAFTLRDAFEQAWKPAATRSKNTEVEVSRYADEFTALNGVLDLKDYTREHWAAWRADCLEKHGPGPTAFKRFSMMKTICNEAIHAGLFERKFFNGQDVTMKKPRKTKLRNEGWLEDELKNLWSSDVFRVKDKKHPDANYWVPVIVALSGARLSEVTGMRVPDVAKRHGLWTFYLARLQGKTEDSRRIIPIPQKIIDLGWLDYIKTRPKDGPLFEDASAKVMSQWFGRVRANIGLTRKGCDLHAFRHHMATLLGDLGAPERISHYITGHAAPNVGGTYGKIELATALRFMDKVDLGIEIPKWQRP